VRPNDPQPQKSPKANRNLAKSEELPADAPCDQSTAYDRPLDCVGAVGRAGKDPTELIATKTAPQGKRTFERYPAPPSRQFNPARKMLPLNSVEGLNVVKVKGGPMNAIPNIGFAV
jgi:hypothetical protein